MNPYQFEVCCSICGEPGMATYRTAGASWIQGNTICHSDPGVCKDNLARKKREKAWEKQKSEIMEKGLGI